MCMSLQRYFFLQYRYQRFQLQVKLRLLPDIIPCRLFLLHISLCLKQLIPQKCRSGHPGSIPLVLITVLRILPKRTLHGNRIFHYHLVDPFPHSLHCSKSSAQHICAARSCSDASYTGLSCMLKARVQRVDPVNGAKLGCHQIVEFTVISSLIANPVTIQPCMAVGLHEPRIDLQPLRVNDFCPLRDLQIRTHGTDLSILDQDISFKRFLFCNRVNQTIFNA